MNVLAHLVLSGSDEDVIFGNFIGDAIKGKKVDDFPEGIRKGLLLHRFIDTYTDEHPIYLESKRRFYENFPKVSGIITDILYDHLLSINWDSHFKHDLKDYSSQIYQFLDTRKEEMPYRVQGMYSHMRTNDWFKRYRSEEGTALSLYQIGRRVNYPKPLNTSIEIYQDSRDVFNSEFNQFFNELAQACKTQFDL